MGSLRRRGKDAPSAHSSCEIRMTSSIPARRTIGLPAISAVTADPAALDQQKKGSPAGRPESQAWRGSRLLGLAAGRSSAAGGRRHVMVVHVGRGMNVMHVMHNVVVNVMLRRRERLLRLRRARHRRLGEGVAGEAGGQKGGSD